MVTLATRYIQQNEVTIVIHFNVSNLIMVYMYSLTRLLIMLVIFHQLIYNIDFWSIIIISLFSFKIAYSFMIWKAMQTKICYFLCIDEYLLVQTNVELCILYICAEITQTNQSPQYVRWRSHIFASLFMCTSRYGHSSVSPQNNIHNEWISMNEFHIWLSEGYGTGIFVCLKRCMECSASWLKNHWLY